MSTNFEDLILRDTRANQPAAGVPGRLYYVTDENMTERDNGATWDDVSDVSGGGAGSDTTAIHDDTASEIHAITEKATPVDADEIVIEDSAASYAKKRVQIGNLPGGGGASTADHFIVGQGGEGDSDLSNKIIIPMLTAHPDIRVAGANDDEFDTTSTLSSTFGTLDTNTSNTIKSHLHLARTVTGAQANGVYKASPAAISFTVTAKISDMIGGIAKSFAGVFVGEATPGKFQAFGLIGQADSNNLGIAWEKWTNPTTRTDWSDANGFQARALPMYVRIAVDGDGKLDFYWSLGGFVYSHYAGYPTTFPHDPGFTIGSVGLVAIGYSSGHKAEAVFDWLRLA